MDAKVVTRKVSMENLSKGVNPKLDIAFGISSRGKAIFATIAQNIYPIGRKLVVPVHLCNEVRTGSAWINAAHWKGKNYVVALTAPDPLSVLMAKVIKTLVKTMKVWEKSMVYFPGNSTFEEGFSSYYLGAEKKEELVKIPDVYAKSIRFLNENELIFVSENKIWKINLKDVGALCWVSRSEELWETKEDIRFIDKPYGNTLAVTLESGEAFFLNLRTKKKTKFLESNCLACFNNIEAGTTAVLRKSGARKDIVFYPISYNAQ
ncbi:MAG: hypothetical protein AAB596_00240 [Patescibacteria group bacterium]